MAGDQDLTQLLPEPPPVRAAGRDTAIAAAMRRFDGIEPAAPPRRARAPWLASGWRPAGAFASVLLVALISIPLALREPGGPIGPSHPPAPRPAELAPTAGGPPLAPAIAPLAGRTDCPPGGCASKAGKEQAPAAPRVETPPAAKVTQDEAPAAREQAEVAPPAFAEAPAPPPPPAPARPAPEPVIAEDAESIVVTGTRVASPSRAAPRFAAKPGSNMGRADGRVRRSASPAAPAAARRGDWNACTVNDPEPGLAGCSRLVDPDAKGPAGEAAQRVSDGLAQARRGDLDGALAAFDQALKLQPRAAFAYLNRGLVHKRRGDIEQASADLDRAVRYAPNAARNYYARSLLRRERGDSRRADADAARAVELDPRYAALID